MNPSGLEAVSGLFAFLQVPSGLAAKDDAAGAMGGLIACFGTFMLIFAVFAVVTILIGWKLFTKAGRPGWEAIVPIYNQWIFVTEICKKEPLWFVLSIIPVLNIVAGWVLCQELAKKFGKSEMFGIALFFFGPIPLAILAFGDAKYQGGKKRSYDDFDDEEEEEEEPRPKKKKRSYDED